MEEAENDRAPSAIISFNAEPLLYTLINAVAAERHKTISSKKGSLKGLSKVVDRVTRLVSYREPGRIPYFFCHGLLPFPKASTRFKKDTDLGKLVFSESEYLALANTSFAWQSSAFLDVALFRQIVFLGVSLSDQNMRRWLAWIHAARTKELTRLGGSGPSTTHYWITKHASTQAEERWVESCVAHLGVRVVWLSAWNELGPCLRDAFS